MSELRLSRVKHNIRLRKKSWAGRIYMKSVRCATPGHDVNCKNSDKIFQQQYLRWKYLLVSGEQVQDDGGRGGGEEVDLTSLLSHSLF